MSTPRTYAQLCRLPAVFTAMADIILGFLLTHLDLSPVRDVAGLLVSSSGLYLAGMVLNDVFDRHVDARERPHRPIPSGRVPLRNAVILAVGLVVIGLAAAAFVGRLTLVVALILFGNILLYDGLLKSTPVGPLVMGGCRFLNVILGASAAGTRVIQAFLLPQLLVAIGMGVYVAGVTWFARKEAETSKRSGLIFGLVVVNLGLLLLAAWIAPEGEVLLRLVGWVGYPGDGDPWRSLVILGVIAFLLNRRAISAILDRSPAAVQSTVRVMLLSIITLDAMLIYHKLGADGVPYAAGVIALLIPSLALGRWMSIT